MTHLLKKELTELLNKQNLIGMAVSFLMIVILGLLMTTALSDEVMGGGTLRLIDCDRTDFTRQVIRTLEDKGYQVELGEGDFATLSEERDWTSAVVLPEGMTAALLERHEAAELETYAHLKTVSAMAMSTGAGESIVAAAVQAVLAEELLPEELAFLEKPTTVKAHTHANGRTVQADPITIVSSVALFDTLMPLVLFLLVILTAQTIISAIAAEKTDKTLETLLAAPVPRMHILGAKMLAALIVALLYAAVYGVGFFTSMLTTVGGAMGDIDLGTAFTNIGKTHNAVVELGLEIPVMGWVGVLAQLALTLGIALTAAIILGGLVEDAKGSQTACMPIMLCTMFPYILTMVSDIRSMDAPVRMLLYAIPFTHTFIATGCMRFHDAATFWGGLGYQAVFLIVMIVAALKLYSSDILFVHSGARKKAKKQAE